jgi:uncharacterized tellurite resistance protein B-like protein
MAKLTPGALSEIIKNTAPNIYNSIIIDTAVPEKEYNYCYIEAYSQKVEYKTEYRSAAIDKGLEEKMLSLINNASNQYVEIDDEFIERFKNAPKYSTEGFFNSTKRKMGELINGGRIIDHHYIHLAEENDHLSKNQSYYAIKAECKVVDCWECKGVGSIERPDSQGVQTSVVCPECKGLGRVGTLAFFVPKVTEKRASLTICLDGDIDGFPTSSIKSHIDDKPVLKRMLKHINGVDVEDYDTELLPYLDILHDKIGEGNALEDIYYHIVPCYTFSYRNILTGELLKGVLLNPSESPDIILYESEKSKVLNRMKDSAKLVGRFLGSIGKGSSKRNKDDLKRTIRLLIATVVADGIVSEEEKQSLTLAIRNIDELTGKEQESLSLLLNADNAGFLEEEDFLFDDADVADETLMRMQEIADCDGLVHETERDIIERLKLQQNG